MAHLALKSASPLAASPAAKAPGQTSIAAQVAANNAVFLILISLVDADCGVSMPRWVVKCYQKGGRGGKQRDTGG
jgi:hypothetical protein